MSNSKLSALFLVLTSQKLRNPLNIELIHNLEMVQNYTPSTYWFQNTLVIHLWSKFDHFFNDFSFKLFNYFFKYMVLNHCL